jgi:peptidoglycan/xylan/chitin deacetylase (PgdA/CDA1 family)
MGRFTPAWASGLLATAVLLGLAFVSVDSSTPVPHARTRVAVARPAAFARPVHVVTASTPVDGSAAVRVAVARHATAHAPCSAGLIALTFDDGPNPAVTAKLVSLLLKLKVPATFFMIGEHVDAHPQLARLVQSKGFTIGNHTWNHPQLTHLSNPEIRDQLLATSAAFKRHFIKPSHLMRPPYGDINDRVRNVVHELGMTPVLWTNDSRDWAGGDSVTIAHRILVALRPHGTNLVLQHDGVDNSPASLGAVPIVVRRARESGYCFTHLNSTGGVGGGTAPSTAKRIVPVSTAPRTGSTTTATRAVATSVVSQPKAVRPNQLRLLFASRAALRMPRSAYWHQFALKLPLHRN